MKKIILVLLISLAACNKNSKFGTTNVADEAFFKSRPTTLTFTAGDPWKPVLELKPDGTFVWYKPGEKEPVVVEDQKELVAAFRDAIRGICPGRLDNEKSKEVLAP